MSRDLRFIAPQQTFSTMKSFRSRPLHSGGWGALEAALAKLREFEAAHLRAGASVARQLQRYIQIWFPKTLPNNTGREIERALSEISQRSLELSQVDLLIDRHPSTLTSGRSAGKG